MSIDEHVKWLLEGVEAWNRRPKEDTFKSNFSGADLYTKFKNAGKLDNAGRIPLAGVNLSGAKLQQTQLISADLSRANLDKANLSGVNLEKAKLGGAYLNFADFSNANLSFADLTNARLEHANLCGANLRNANLTGANLNGAKPWEAWIFSSEEESGKSPKQETLKGTDIQNIADLLDQIRQIQETHEGIPLYFRGESTCEWDMRPSVIRDNFIKKSESVMLRDLMSTRPEEFNGINSALSQWVLAQHHGLSTRFLDITKNPLVALFFACESKDYEQKNGHIRIFAVPYSLVKPFNSDAISIVANFAKLPLAEQTLLLGNRQNNFMRKYPEIMDRLCQLIQSEKPYFANRIDVRDFYRVFVVEPQQSSERIRAQSGAFLVSAFHERFERDKILNCNKDIPVYAYYELDIPHKHKPAIIKDLRLMNITKETLFPGLGTSAEAVTSRYSTRQDSP